MNEQSQLFAVVGRNAQPYYELIWICDYFDSLIIPQKETIVKCRAGGCVNIAEGMRKTDKLRLVGFFGR